jgi:hypothetical protein
VTGTVTEAKIRPPIVEAARTRAGADCVLRLRGGLATVLALSIGLGRPVAASPVGPDMDAASVTLAEAEKQLAAGDPDGAIALFEGALAQIPTEPGYAPARARVLLTIVEAHEAAFGRDGELERLRRAKRLLDHYLGPLELLDEQGRAAAEERRVRLIDAITAVEEKMRAEEAARSAAARRDRAAAARRKGRAFSRSGAVLTSFGGAGLVLLGVGLGLGRATDGKIADLKASKLAQGDDWGLPCIDDACREARRAELDPLFARGTASNVLVLVGALTGGTLLAGGVTLLVLGRKKTREARSLEITPVPAVGPTSFGLTLRGRF